MSNIIQLVFDPDEIAVVKMEHLVKFYRLDDEARLQRKMRTRRRRKTKRVGSNPLKG